MPRKAEPTVDLAIPIGTTATAALLQMSPHKLIGLTHRNVLHHMRDTAGVPVGGKYLLNQAVADYVNYVTHKAEHAPRSQYDDARARRALAAAAVSEIKVKRLSGEMIEMGPVLEAIDALLLRFRAKVQTVFPRMAREAYGASSLANALERIENLAGEIFDELRKIPPEDLEKPRLRALPGAINEQEGSV
jgi:hypothetical protein